MNSVTNPNSANTNNTQSSIVRRSPMSLLPTVSAHLMDGKYIPNPKGAQVARFMQRLAAGVPK